MALIFREMTGWAICGELIQEDDDVVTTPHFILTAAGAHTYQLSFNVPRCTINAGVRSPAGSRETGFQSILEH